MLLLLLFREEFEFDVVRWEGMGVGVTCPQR